MNKPKRIVFQRGKKTERIVSKLHKNIDDTSKFIWNYGYQLS